MKKLLTVLILANVVLASGISISSLNSWTSLRSNNINIRYVAGSEMIGKKFTFVLKKASAEKSSVIKRQIINVNALKDTVNLSVPDTVLGGKDFYSLSWIEDTIVNIIEPIGLAPVLTPEEMSVDTILSVGEKAKIIHGVNFSWSHDKLKIIVDNDNTKTISIDPANSKKAFLSFPNRIVKFNNGSVDFFYLTRVFKDGKVKYLKNKWQGKFTTTVENGRTVIEIPWYELGMKVAKGRIFGLMVDSGSNVYPYDAQAYIPATWGNFILK